MIITVEWEHVERLRNRLEVPDDATSAQITELAVIESARGRAGKMDEIIASAIGHVSWKAGDGRFGGRVQ